MYEEIKLSRQNIIFIGPDPEQLLELVVDPEAALFMALEPSIIVTFQSRDGSVRSYRYSGLAAVTGIIAGDDPARYSGTQV